MVKRIDFVWCIFYHTHKKHFILGLEMTRVGMGGVEGIWIDDADGSLRLCSL